MSKEERYAEHTVAWELPNGDSVTKSNYNLADIETKYMSIQTEVICDDKDKTIADLEAKLAESESEVAVGRFWHSAYEGKQLDYDKLNNDYNKQEKLLSEVLADKSKLQFEFDQLKQQLAEKEKVIMELASKVDLLESEKENLFRTLEEANEDYQDKISFAVDILEELADCSNYINSKLDFECGSYVLEKAIRDKIKSLKGKKDE